jgi:hypothetical protein
MILLLNAIIPPVMTLLNPGYYIKKIQRRSLENKVKKDKSKTLVT